MGKKITPNGLRNSFWDRATQMAWIIAWGRDNKERTGWEGQTHSWLPSQGFSNGKNE